VTRTVETESVALVESLSPHVRLEDPKLCRFFTKKLIEQSLPEPRARCVDEQRVHLSTACRLDPNCARPARPARRQANQSIVRLGDEAALPPDQ